MNRVPFASGTVQFKYVTPCLVHVVGSSETDDWGRYFAYFELLSYVIGMLNELPSGMTPNIEGGYVVFPRFSDELPVGARLLSSAGPPMISSIASSRASPARLAMVPVTFDSSEVGHDMVRLEHWGG
jgi:hypothetical protein